MAEVVQLAPVGLAVNAEAVELVATLLERVRSGEVLAVGLVQVGRGGDVATAYSNSNCYHALNSGAARLANRLASVPDDT